MAEYLEEFSLEKAREVVTSLGTANISDALDRLGIRGRTLALAPLAPGQRMAGPAFTVRYVPVGTRPGTVGDFLDDCVRGQVVVLDNTGRVDCTVWGEIMTRVAHQRGLAGTVINGVCRDVAWAETLRYPIYSRGRFMRTGKDRVEVAGVNVPVSVGESRVDPGDFVVGDDDGVVVIPMEFLQKVISVAGEIAEAEARIVEECTREGTSLLAARSRHNYHLLQRTAFDEFA